MLGKIFLDCLGFLSNAHSNDKKATHTHHEPLLDIFYGGTLLAIRLRLAAPASAAADLPQPPATTAFGRGGK